MVYFSLLTFSFSSDADELLSFLWWVKSRPSSFKTSMDGLQINLFIFDILLRQSSISALYFSTQAADDAITAASPKTSTIKPDSLHKNAKSYM